MRKWLAILGLLLAAPVCAEKPLPVNGGQQQQQPQNQANATQPATPQPCASDVCKENADNAERYAYYKAHPKEYLKAAVAPANLSNWVLAGLGVIAGALAILTLLVLKRQVDMFISKERARLTIEFDSFEFAEPDTLSSVNFTVTNHGSTNAFVISAKCLVCIKEGQPDLNTIPRMYEMNLPKAIAPKPEGSREFQLVDTGDKMLGRLDGNTYNALQFREKRMYAVGYIEFLDVFDTAWRLRFCRRWGGDYSMGQWWFTHEWLDYGRGPKNKYGKTNGEERIPTVSLLERLIVSIRELGGLLVRASEKPN